MHSHLSMHHGHHLARQSYRQRPRVQRKAKARGSNGLFFRRRAGGREVWEEIVMRSLVGGSMMQLYTESDILDLHTLVGTIVTRS